MIDLHYVATPNGRKITLMLDETNTPYRVIMYDIFEGDHLTPEFGHINPNHKLPAIVDREPADGGPPLPVFESGAILQYLAEKTGRFLPTDPRKRSITLQWMTWQVACLGPMGGQAAHFVRYAPEGQEYGIQRYMKELRRLLAVLDKRLSKVEYIAGDEYTIADMALWPGRAGGASLGINQREEYPHIQRWYDQIAERPVVKTNVARSEMAAPKKYGNKRQVLSAKEWSNMFGDRMHGAVLLD